MSSFDIGRTLFTKDRLANMRHNIDPTSPNQRMGIAPTGRSLELTFICIFRLADGRLAERWPQFDFYSWMEQLRAGPE